MGRNQPNLGRPLRNHDDCPWTPVHRPLRRQHGLRQADLPEASPRTSHNTSARKQGRSDMSSRGRLKADDLTRCGMSPASMVSRKLVLSVGRAEADPAMAHRSLAGVDLRSIRGQAGVDLRPIRGRFWAALGPIWTRLGINPFGVDLASNWGQVWSRFEDDPGPIWAHFWEWVDLLFRPRCRGSLVHLRVPSTRILS